MIIKHSAERAESLPKTPFQRSVPPAVAVANCESEQAKIRLHEALAREESLRFRIAELIRELSAWRGIAAKHVAGLTPRQRQVMELILAGRPNKTIAAELGISQRTVENHRASIMRKTGSKSLPALVRLALVAAEKSAPDQIPYRTTDEAAEPRNRAVDIAAAQRAS